MLTVSFGPRVGDGCVWEGDQRDGWTKWGVMKSDGDGGLRIKGKKIKEEKRTCFDVVVGEVTEISRKLRDSRHDVDVHFWKVP